MERPILFSGPMIRAILEGRKTQTRRVARFTDAGHLKEPGRNRRWHRDDPDAALACPYGQPGDSLWVREAWRVARINGKLGAGSEFATVQFREGYGVLPYRKDWMAHYAHLLQSETEWEPSETGNLWGKWRPSIFMPRWASRLTLRVTGVRVERLHDISEDDARAEGIEFQDDAKDAWRGWKSFDGTCLYESARESFEKGWDTINGKRAPWASNPYVWVLAFDAAPPTPPAR